MAEQSKPTFNHICIEGVIGVGKTSLCKLLAERFSARTILEQVEENPFLSQFYRNKEVYAFQTQLWFLLSRYRQLSEESIQQDLFHETVVSDYMFAKDRIFASVNLDDNEIVLYNNVAKILEREIPQPDLVIYLQASTDVLMKRIDKRGRQYESNMDRAYIENLNQAYNHFFFHYTNSTVLIINTNEIDFVNNEVDLDEITGQILQTKSGINFYQPLGKDDKLKLAAEDKKKKQE
ncbi:MAG: AAA family ATPase [Chitinivibrionales bacterium]|nr:AAA family ATPase [Chitinivibrionales bacterium]